MRFLCWNKWVFFTVVCGLQYPLWSGWTPQALWFWAAYISTGTEPQNRYHATSQILVFSTIIRKCIDQSWSWARICLLHESTGSGLCRTIEIQGSLMSMAQFKERVAECGDFLLRNGLSPDTLSAGRRSIKEWNISPPPQVHYHLDTAEKLAYGGKWFKRSVWNSNPQNVASTIIIRIRLDSNNPQMACKFRRAWTNVLFHRQLLIPLQASPSSKSMQGTQNSTISVADAHSLNLSPLRRAHHDFFR